MKQGIEKYILEIQWFPTLFFLIFITVNFYLKIIPLYIAIPLGMVFLLIAGIIQLFNKKWKVGIINLGIVFFTIFIFVVFSFLLEFTGFGLDRDNFADNLKLPENVKLENPIDLIKGDNFETIRPKISPKISNNQKIDFQLYNSFQPGVYQFDIWVESQESGLIFIKAYEITQNIELSNLKENTGIRIEDTNGVIEKFSTKDDFFIYEGDWGKPYGARFEIWFKPDNNSKEKKIFEKKHIIEGWQR